MIRRDTGDFHGRPTVRIESDTIAIEALARAGPRIVGLRRRGGTENLLAETPDLGWETASGRYELFGGHRLWFAPEDPDLVAVPDSDGVTVEALPGGLRLTGAAEPATGCVRSIEVTLDPVRPWLGVRHEIRNDGRRPIELAPWSITQLPLGGRALLPQRRAVSGHHTRPDRNLVLWPYSSWEDARLRIRDGLVTVDAAAGAGLKVGCLADPGWVAYVRGGTALVRRFEPEAGAPYPDLGCNVETYCGSRYLELEVLGPTRVLDPGAAATLHERWELLDVGTADDLVLRDALSRPIDAPAARSA